MKAQVLTFVLLAVATLAKGQVFKCPDGYSDRPCQNGKEIRLRENTIDGSAASTRRMLDKTSGEVQKSEGRGSGAPAPTSNNPQALGGDRFKTYKQYDSRGNERYNPDADNRDNKFRDYKQYGTQDRLYR